MRNAAQASEELLARLFTDAQFRVRFKQDAQGVGRELGLDDAALAALANTDWVGLDLAARSYAKKRETYSGRKRRWWPFSRLFNKR
jgi:hypothetical protein